MPLCDEPPVREAQISTPYSSCCGGECHVTVCAQAKDLAEALADELMGEEDES